MIIRNAAQCAQCKDIIESTHVHDFKYCSCESVFVDGGKEYLRHGWKEPGDLIDLSEVAE
jgi:hypothetical protein